MCLNCRKVTGNQKSNKLKKIHSKDQKLGKKEQPLIFHSAVNSYLF